MDYTIYTDGGARPTNPGPGGWGVIAVSKNDGKEYEFSGGDKQTTNNRMELIAVITALKVFNGNTIEIVTDSQYVKKGITEWIKTWKRNGWRTADRKPVKNKDLWEELDRLVSSNTVTFNWIRGHDGNAYNERADGLATDAALRAMHGTPCIKAPEKYLAILGVSKSSIISDAAGPSTELDSSLQSSELL